MRLNQILKETFEDEYADANAHVKTLLVMLKEVNQTQHQQFVKRYETIPNLDSCDNPDECIDALEELADQIQPIVQDYYGNDFVYTYSKSEQPG